MSVAFLGAGESESVPGTNRHALEPLRNSSWWNPLSWFVGFVGKKPINKELVKWISNLSILQTARLWRRQKIDIPEHIVMIARNNISSINTLDGWDALCVEVGKKSWLLNSTQRCNKTGRMEYGNQLQEQLLTATNSKLNVANEHDKALIRKFNGEQQIGLNAG
jgi:hypothetical protein